MIGIFGGTFDPIHYGHLLVAQAALQDVSKVIFVPTAQNPFKTKENSSAEHRLSMVELATSPFKDFEVETYEIDKGGVNYTIDTLKYLKDKYPDDELALIVGVDEIFEMKEWKNIDEFGSFCSILVCSRPSVNIDSLLQHHILPIMTSLHVKWHYLRPTPLNISSTQLRNLVKLNLPNPELLLEHYMSKNVANYIVEHQLYKEKK